MSPAPELTVIIPAWNEAGHIAGTLSALRADGYDGCELVVVDDASGDGTAEAAAPLADRVLRQTENLGVAAARNRGAREGRGEILVFLDADVVVPPGFLGTVAESFRKAPALGVLQAISAEKSANGGFGPDLLALQWRFGWLAGGPSSNALNSYAFAVRREIFERSGGFDERYRHHPGGEEYEFAARLSGLSPLTIRRDLAVRHSFERVLPRTKTLFRRAFRFGCLLGSGNPLPLHGGGRPAEAIAAVLAMGGAVSLPFALLTPAAGVLALLLLLLYVLSRTALLTYIGSRKGAAFAIASIPALWLWSLAGGAGTGAGIIRTRLFPAGGRP